jgi:hypothetical protein
MNASGGEMPDNAFEQTAEDRGVQCRGEADVLAVELLGAVLALSRSAVQHGAS